jgi:hypothetical protein
LDEGFFDFNYILTVVKGCIEMWIIVLKVLAFAFLATGFTIVYSAKSVVKKYEMDKKVECNFEGELSDEEVAKYKFDKASVNVKMMGLVISIPGIILLYLLFR